MAGAALSGNKKKDSAAVIRYDPILLDKKTISHHRATFMTKYAVLLCNRTQENHKNTTNHRTNSAAQDDGNAFALSSESQGNLTFVRSAIDCVVASSIVNI